MKKVTRIVVLNLIEMVTLPKIVTRMFFRRGNNTRID